MNCHLYPVTILCIELDYCANSWGEGLCIAPALPSQSNLKPCFNTFSTCKNKYQFFTGECQTGEQVSGYSCTTKKYYFSTCELPKSLIQEIEQDGVYLGPVIKEKSVKFKTGLMSLTNSLSTRSSLTMQISDFDHNDDQIDPYLEQRDWFKIHDASSKPSGTFWGRFLARNKFLQNKPVKIYTGDCEDSFSNFDESLFLLEYITQTGNGCVDLKALDPFSFADEKNQKCPKPYTDVSGQQQYLTRSINDTELGRFPLSAVSFSGPDKSALEYQYYINNTLNLPVYLCVGDEVIEGNWIKHNLNQAALEYVPLDSLDPAAFCDTGETAQTFTFIPSQRGALGSDPQEHEAGTPVRFALCFPAGMPIVCVIQNILETCTNLTQVASLCCEDDPLRFIDFAGAGIVNCTAMKRLMCHVIICEEEDTKDLLNELTEQFGFRLRYDDKIQKVTWTEYKPPTECDFVRHFSECDYEEKTFSYKRKVRSRINKINWYWDQRSLSEELKKENFNRVNSCVDTDSLSCFGDGVASEKNIFSRWICEANSYLIKCNSQRLIQQLICDQYELQFNTSKCGIEQSYDNQTLCVGDFFTAENCNFQDECGEEENLSRRIFQIVQLIPSTDDCITVVAESTPFKSSDCYVQSLCGEGDCGLAANDPVVLVEGTDYHCSCQVY